MNISNISNQLYTTAPDKTGRLPKEMAVYSLLDELSIPYERVDHDNGSLREHRHASWRVHVQKLIFKKPAENCFLPSDDSWQKKV